MRSRFHSFWIFAAFIAAVSLITTSIVLYNRITATRIFTFAQDFVDFANAYGRFPGSVDEFCLAITNRNGGEVWNLGDTKKKVRFVNDLNTNSSSSKRIVIQFLDPSIKKYEESVNRYILLRIPSDIANGSIINTNRAIIYEAGRNRK